MYRRSERCSKLMMIITSFYCSYFNLKQLSIIRLSQETITYSKSKIKANKCFTPCSTVFIVDFVQVNAGWDIEIWFREICDTQKLTKIILLKE